MCFEIWFFPSSDNQEGHQGVVSTELHDDAGCLIDRNILYFDISRNG